MQEGLPENQGCSFKEEITMDFSQFLSYLCGCNLLLAFVATAVIVIIVFFAKKSNE